MHIIHGKLGQRNKAWIIMPAVAVLLILGLLSYLLFVRSGTKAEVQLRENLITAASLAALQINPEHLAQIHQAEDEQTEAYQTVVTQLIGLQDVIPDAHFMYIMRKAPGDDPFMLSFIVEADGLKSDAELDTNGNGTVDVDEERSYSGDLYDSRDAPAMLEAFIAPASDQEITTDQWGTFISGYAPIKDATGNTVAILGIDMTAQDFLARAQDFFPFLAVLLFTGIGAVFALYIGTLVWERAEQERARAVLLHNLPGMAYRCGQDEHWTMEFVSDGCTSLTDYAPSDLIGNKIMSYGDLIHPDDRKGVAEGVQVALSQHKPFLLTYRIRTKNGTEKWVWEQGSEVLGIDGRVVALEGFIMDTTEQKQLEVAKSEFLRAASHQLRTPITAVRWALSSLADSKEQPLQGLQKDIVAGADQYIVRMAQTVDMMLRVSEIESVKVRPTMLDVPLKSLLDEWQVQFAKLLADKKLTCILECPEALTVHTDPVIVQEILSVLIRNAIMYSSSGNKVHISAQQNGRSVRIDVSDTGCGIPRQEQYKVFTRFFRASNAEKHSPEGTGLGLTLAYALVRILRGEISFVSEEGKGSTFSLVLPGAADRPPVLGEEHVAGEV
jgi:PAS domain S-box-containing protein